MACKSEGLEARVCELESGLEAAKRSIKVNRAKSASLNIVLQDRLNRAKKRVRSLEIGLAAAMRYILLHSHPVALELSRADDDVENEFSASYEAVLDRLENHPE